MRLKMEIEMDEASLHLSSARRAPLLLAGGGGFNRSAHSAGPFSFLQMVCWFVDLFFVGLQVLLYVIFVKKTS